MGELTFDFYAGPTGRWDKGNELYVTLYDGALRLRHRHRTVRRRQCARGRERRRRMGDRPVPRCRTRRRQPVEADHAAARAGGQRRRHALAGGAGARVVVLDEALPQLALTARSAQPRASSIAGVRSGKDISDPAYQGATHAFAGIGLRPLSPTACARAGRRSRATSRSRGFGARASAATSGTAPTFRCRRNREAYEIDIYDGANVVRTLSRVAADRYLHARATDRRFRRPAMERDRRGLSALGQFRPWPGRTPHFITNPASPPVHLSQAVTRPGGGQSGTNHDRQHQSCASLSRRGAGAETRHRQ